jgi:Family of unknown function (DUF6223)
MSVYLLLAAPATAHIFAAGGYGPGSGRFGAIVAGVVGLISVAIGGLALARSAGRIGIGNARSGAIGALAVGLTGMVLGAWHLVRSADGFGTGNGRAGAIVALVLALIGMSLGGLALARSRRAGPAIVPGEYPDVGVSQPNSITRCVPAAVNTTRRSDHDDRTD